MNIAQLESIVDDLNNYPITQNDHPLFVISSNQEQVSYFKKWSDTIPCKTLDIERCLEVNNKSELKALFY